MTVVTRQQRQSIPSCVPTFIYIGNEKVEEVATHNVLGVTIDNNLSWKNHASELTKRISQKLYQLSKIKHFLNAHAQKQFFHAHIQSTIYYASTMRTHSKPRTSHYRSP